jgi:hypothetical protein
MHPGGLSVLLDEEVGVSRNSYIPEVSLTGFFLTTAGKDVTEAFFGLHRYEVLEKPQYKRLQIGIIEGEKSVIHGRTPGAISKIPYAEPTWLSEGFHSPYYTEVCRRVTVIAVERPSNKYV